MSNNFGYLDLILLAMIAGFIILRLRNVLGRKTGHEGKVVSNLSEKKFEEFKKIINPAIIAKSIMSRYPKLLLINC